LKTAPKWQMLTNACSWCRFNSRKADNFCSIYSIVR